MFQTAKQAEIDRGVPQQTSDITLARLIDEFKQARLAGASYSTTVGYANTFGQLLKYFGAEKPLHAIMQRYAEAFLAGRRRLNGSPKDLASWTRARHLIHCRALFGAAVDWGYVSGNPFRAGRGAGGATLRIRAKSRPWHHLTPSEFQQMLAVVTGARQRAVLWFMYGCGLRAGEAYNLTVDRIELVRRKVYIASRAASDQLPPFAVKAESQSDEGKERSVPIPEAAIPDVRESMRQALATGGLIALSRDRFATMQSNWRLCREGKPFGKSKEHRPWQNRHMINNFLRNAKNALLRAGIELSALFTLHTLRKSFAQNLADAGTPPRTLAKLLGHSNPRMTMLFYNRVTDANEQAAHLVLDRLFITPAVDRLVQ